MVTKLSSRPLFYLRLLAGFCGIAMVAVGSTYVLAHLGDLADETLWLYPAGWLEFDGPILLAMLAVNAGVLAMITLVILRQVRYRAPPATNPDHTGRRSANHIRDALEMVSRIILHPNSAFAALRDDDRRYFRSSIVVMLLTSIVGAGLGSTMPAIAEQQTANAVTIFGMTVLSIVTSTGIVYLIGRAFGGNRNWRKVLTVLFYVNVIEIPIATVLAASSLLYPVAPAMIELHEGLHIPFSLSPGLLGATYVMMAITLLWAVIICIKAIKVLNSFSTAKAFGVLVLSGIIQVVWIILVVIPYLWITGFGLPIM